MSKTLNTGEKNSFKHYKGCPCLDCKNNGYDRVNEFNVYIAIEQPAGCDGAERATAQRIHELTYD